jgi:hypothetical protein
VEKIKIRIIKKKFIKVRLIMFMKKKGISISTIRLSLSENNKK